MRLSVPCRPAPPRSRSRRAFARFGISAHARTTQTVVRRGLRATGLARTADRTVEPAWEKEIILAAVTTNARRAGPATRRAHAEAPPLREDYATRPLPFSTARFASPRWTGDKPARRFAGNFIGRDRQRRLRAGTQTRLSWSSPRSERDRQKQVNESP